MEAAAELLLRVSFVCFAQEKELEAEKKPFLAYMAYYALHTPFQPNKKYIANYEDAEYSRLQAIESDSKLEDDAKFANKERRPTHIDFQPRNRKERLSFDEFLDKEMLLRYEGREDHAKCREFVRGNIKEKRAILKEEVKHQNKIVDGKFTIDRNEHAGWFTAEQAIPCVLHLIIRISEKLFWGLISHCIDRCYVGDSEKRNQFVDAVTAYMNDNALGKRTVGHGYKKLWSLKLVPTGDVCLFVFQPPVRDLWGDD